MVVMVGSQNPVKIKAVEEAFGKYFENVEVKSFDTDSNVPVQPVNHETFSGARNRAVNLLEINNHSSINADFFVGIEGGIVKYFDKWFGLGAMCIIDKDGNTGYGTSPQFELPESVIKELLTGRELGDVMDEIMNENNTKYKNGAIGFLTNGVLDRKGLYVQGLVVALVPFVHKDLFFESHKNEL